MRHPTLIALVLALALPLLPAAAPPAAAAPKATVFAECGPDAAAIQDTVDAFRAALGTLNPNVAGSFGSGRREINWDAVPDQFADPNALPPDFFNVNSPRGAVFSTSGSEVRVSANAVNPTNTPIEFGGINPTYPGEFSVFSPQRLFAPIGSRDVEVRFFVAGSATPAVVSGFGAIFTDVERQHKTTITYYDEAGKKIATLAVPPGPDGGLCFLGALDFRKAELGISRVRITTGTTPLGPDDQSRNRDVVVMDDFIYGEPRPNTGGD